MSEKDIREKWAAFCDAAKSAQNIKVVPGRTINDAPAISTTGELPKEADPVVEEKPKAKKSKDSLRWAD